MSDLRALDSPHITSRSVLTCRISLDAGHRDIPGNCKADELAREGTTTELQSLHNDYDIPIATLKLNFEEESIREAILRWLNTSVCRQLKLVWPPINKKRTLDPLFLKRNNIFKAIGDTDDGETTEHFLCSCPALAVVRLKTLENYFFENPIELSNTSIKDLMCFINGTKWFTGYF